MSYLKELYYKEVKKSLKDKFNFKNELEIPRLSKVSLNIAFKHEMVEDKAFLKYVVEQLSLIAGQKAVLVKAKKSISSFKIRAGDPISCIVTLRGNKMYEFLDRLIFIALPKIKDFKGLPKKTFNQSGHYSFGIKEHTVFPEIDLDKAYKILGMDVNVITTSKNVEQARELLIALKFPIKQL